MQIAVTGAAKATDAESEAAYATGALIARHGGILICGGLGGVMESACRGAREHGGLTVGIVSGTDDGNPYLDIVIRTGLGHARNVLVAQSGEATEPSRRSRSPSRPGARSSALPAGISTG